MEGKNGLEFISKPLSESEPFSSGGTLIIVQRHERYVRDLADPSAGNLTPEGKERVFEQTRETFKSILGGVPEEELSGVNVLVVASDTHFHGKPEYGQRCMDTAQQVIKGLQEVLVENSLSKDQVLNEHRKESLGRSRFRGGKGQPRPASRLREPKMFNESPNFLQFLRDRYDNWEDLMFAFEEDRHREVREGMQAEGPWEIADRLGSFIDVLRRYSQAYHVKNPNKRLVIWVATHFDLISPYIKKYLSDQPKTDSLPVNYGGGFCINVPPSGEEATASIAGTKYKVPPKHSLA